MCDLLALCWHFSGGIRALRCVWRVWSKALTQLTLLFGAAFRIFQIPEAPCALSLDSWGMRTLYSVVLLLRNMALVLRRKLPVGPMAAAGCWEISFDFTDVKRYQAGRCPGPMLRFLEAWQYHLEEAKLEVQPSQPLGESLTVRMRDASWHFWRAVLPLKTLQRACQERWCCKESAAKYSNGM